MHRLFLELLQDGFFAGIAAIGFGSISNVPFSAFRGCAVLGALGHMMRYALMTGAGWSIVPAAFVGALLIGLLSPTISHHEKTPPEALAFPALLPMIPGMYAYRAVEGFLMCIKAESEEGFMHAFYLLNYNFMITVVIILFMVLGVITPIRIDHRRHDQI